MRCFAALACQCNDAGNSRLLTMALLVRHSIETEPLNAPVLSRYARNGSLGTVQTESETGRRTPDAHLLSQLVWAIVAVSGLGLPVNASSSKNAVPKFGPKAVGKHCRRHCVRRSLHQVQSGLNCFTLLVSELMRKEPRDREQDNLACGVGCQLPGFAKSIRRHTAAVADK
jgi:hypothetical protein